MSKTVVVVCECRSMKGVAECYLCVRVVVSVCQGMLPVKMSLSRKLLFLKLCVCVRVSLLSLMTVAYDSVWL